MCVETFPSKHQPTFPTGVKAVASLGTLAKDYGGEWMTVCSNSPQLMRACLNSLWHLQRPERASHGDHGLVIQAEGNLHPTPVVPHLLCADLQHMLGGKVTRTKPIR
jgi:hypothetical protein